MNCRGCGFPYEPGAIFCRNCGQVLGPPPGQPIQLDHPAPPMAVPGARAQAQVPGGAWQGPRPAGFWRRGFALILDLIPWLLMLFALGWILDWVRGECLSRMVLDPQGRLHDQVFYRFALLRLGLNIGLPFLYFWMLEGFGGSTLGKKIMGCRVVRSDGAPAGLVRALLRNLLKLLSLVPCLLGFFLSALLPDKRALHDLLTGSRVIRR